MPPPNILEYVPAQLCPSLDGEVLANKDWGFPMVLVQCLASLQFPVNGPLNTYPAAPLLVQPQHTPAMYKNVHSSIK